MDSSLAADSAFSDDARLTVRLIRALSRIEFALYKKVS